MINTAINSALQGIRANQQSFRASARNIAAWGQDRNRGDSGISPERDMVGVLVSRRGYEANLQVVKTADRMLGTLLDTFA